MPFGYLTALLLTFIFSFALGVFTLLINPRSRVHQLWFLANVTRGEKGTDPLSYGSILT